MPQRYANMKIPSHKSKRDFAGGPARREKSARSFKVRFIEWYSSRRVLWGFSLKFCGLMALYYFLVLMPVCDRWFYRYLESNAWLAGQVLTGLGQESHVSEITIRSAQFAITVRRGCDAIEPAWFFCAALFAFPASIGRKIIGILIGTFLLQALNLVRIVSLYFIGVRHPNLFAMAHVEIWPATFIIVAISLLTGWIGWANRNVSPVLHAPT